MPGNLPKRHNPHHSTHHRQCNCFLTPAALFRTGSKIVGLMTHPKNPGKTVSCDGVTRHPIEDGFWRHRRQDLPPRGMFHTRSFYGIAGGTFRIAMHLDRGDRAGHCVVSTEQALDFFLCSITERTLKPRSHSEQNRSYVVNAYSLSTHVHTDQVAAASTNTTKRTIKIAAPAFIPPKPRCNPQSVEADTSTIGRRTSIDVAIMAVLKSKPFFGTQTTIVPANNTVIPRAPTKID